MRREVIERDATVRRVVQLHQLTCQFGARPVLPQQLADAQLVAPRETLVIGFTQLSAFMALSTWALLEGGAGKIAVLVFTMPIWTAILAVLFLGERMGLWKNVAVLAGLVGVAVIVDRGAGKLIEDSGLGYRAAYSLADLGL